LIRNIWAVGRNYADHAKELDNQIPTEPLIFLKAGSCAFFGSEISLPAWTEEVHHEVELALKFGDDLSINAYGLALDLTERKIQTHMKSLGQPWTLAKSFTNSCPITQFHSVHDLNELKDLPLSLIVNGEVKQNGTTADMIFSLERLLEFIKTRFPVCPGDLLLTGTPAGVGPLRRGDKVLGLLGSQIKHNWKIT
jgi:acylpyruvate hydrolase